MKKLLKDLSVEECYELYNEIILNSDRRWKLAKLHVSSEDYCGAIRELIAIRLLNSGKKTNCTYVYPSKHDFYLLLECLYNFSQNNCIVI